MRAEGIPGAIVGVWQNGKGQYVRAFGKAALVPGLAMQSDYLWKAAPKKISPTAAPAR